MTASYTSPTYLVRAFDPKVDYTTTVVAEHINSLQEEVTAIENHLGAGGVLASSGWAGTANLVTTVWTSLKDRLNNMEYGISDGIDAAAAAQSTANTALANAATAQSTANSALAAAGATGVSPLLLIGA